MSTIEQPNQVLPPLEAGQRLDRRTFHERYEAMPAETWAELVGGVVYMPSPRRHEHAGIGQDLSRWIVHYRRRIPVMRSGRNVTTILSDATEVQPDGQLRIPAERGGRTRLADGYVVGPPELVVEIARSTRSFDLGPKMAAYARAGVIEYLFVGLDPDEVRWFSSREGRFVELQPGADGVLRSEVFPGLWLDPGGLFTEDLDRLFTVLEQGLATPEHEAFVARLTGTAGT